VFAQIDPAGSRLSELARGANMSPQAMVELVDEHESLGYVVRRPAPRDRRGLNVLARKGKACVEAGGPPSRTSRTRSPGDPARRDIIRSCASTYGRVDGAPGAWASATVDQGRQRHQAFSVSSPVMVWPWLLAMSIGAA
jgi:MarR family